jgi:hypothetical protein
MAKRPTLPDPIEAAVATLETTSDYAAGVAAERTVKAAARRTWMLEGLVALAWLVPFGLLLTVSDRLPEGLAGGLAAAVLALALTMQWLFDRTGRRRRLEAALNRWRQIAGTLAVTGRTP